MEILMGKLKDLAPLVGPEAFASGIMSDVNDGIYRSAGKGSAFTQLQDFLIRMNRYTNIVLPSNRECVGLTFITRPKLNLSASNLILDRTLERLNTTEVNSVAFMTRFMLDTKLCKSPVYADRLNSSSVIDPRNPFNTPLSNGLIGISGYPDDVIQVSTTEGGYFNEDQTFVQGGDSLRKTYDLTLEFRDVQYAPIMTIFETWVRWMALATEGRVVAYNEDIDRLRIPYSVSIYRFVLDVSKRYIMRANKATGCFPKVGALGSVFNFSEGSEYVSGLNKISVPFTANHIRYNDYVTFISFNMLVRKYVNCNVDKLPTLPDHLSFNMLGVPYIVIEQGLPKIVFKDHSASIGDDGLSPSVSRMYKEIREPMQQRTFIKLIDMQLANGHITRKLYDQIKDKYKTLPGRKRKLRKRALKDAVKRRYGDNNILSYKAYVNPSSVANVDDNKET